MLSLFESIRVLQDPVGAFPRGDPKAVEVFEQGNDVLPCGFQCVPVLGDVQATIAPAILYQFLQGMVVTVNVV